ncbi:MAG: hypothetical protein H6832_12010 [Planctomycetes bacterium]|nr:hypothetical protein [Planctomycetota bacterium]
MRITVASGDGIGPEITDLVVDVLHAASVPLDFEHIEIADAGEAETVGLPMEAELSLASTKVLLHGPIDSPAARKRIQQLLQDGKVDLFTVDHGSHAELVGRDLADPTAMLAAALRMLRHLGLTFHAMRIEHALHQALSLLEPKGHARHRLHKPRTSVFRYLILNRLSADRSDPVDGRRTKPESVPGWPESVHGLRLQLEGLA